MDFETSVRRVRELTAKMQEHADTATRASDTYTAHMTLFNVAASAGDEKAMQIHRDTLHATVDSILDSGAMLAKLRTEYNRIVNGLE